MSLIHWLMTRGSKARRREEQEQARLGSNRLMYGCRLLPVAEVNIIIPPPPPPINPTPPPPILRSTTSDLTLLYTEQKKENDLWKHAFASTFHSSDAWLRLGHSDELNSWSEALGFSALKNELPEDCPQTLRYAALHLKLHTCECKSNTAYLIHKCVLHFTTSCRHRTKAGLKWSYILFLHSSCSVREQELGNMMSHLNMCTQMSSHVNTKLTPLPSPVNKNGWVCSVAGRPAALVAVRPPEWFAKWTRRGCRDCTGRTHMCTLVCRGRHNTAGVCLHAVVLKIFGSLIFYSIFVSINSLNASIACLTFWGVLIDFTDF